MCIRAQARETIGRFIQTEALVRRKEHDQQEGDQRHTQPGEYPALRLCVAFGDGAEGKEHQQRKECHGHQFAETAARIFGVGESVNFDIGCAAEEILKLDRHKRKEESDHTAQHNGRFDITEEWRNEGLAFTCKFLIL